MTLNKNDSSFTLSNSATSLLVLGLLFCALGCSSRPQNVDVALVAPLSGPSSDLGIHVRNGVRLNFQTVETRAKNFPFVLHLVEADDKADPQANLDEVKKLYDQGIRIIMMDTYSAAAAQSVPWASEHGMLVLSSTIGADNFTGKDDLFLRSSMSSAQFGVKVAEYAARMNLQTGVHIIRDATNKAYAQAVASAFDTEIRKQNGKVEQDVTLDIATEKNLSQAVLPHNADNPSAYLIIAGAVNAAKVAQALRKGGHKETIFLLPIAYTDELVQYGGSAVENSIILWTENAGTTSEQYKNFESLFNDTFGTKPNGFASAGWQVADMLVQSLAGAKSNDPLKIKEFIVKNGGFSSVLGNQVVLDKNGDAQLTNVGFYIVKNGAFVKIED